jgi:predicted MFS family arabinose efflux permease
LLIGAVGASLAATGGELRWFPLFVIGMLAFGAGQAATLQQRYVAADLAQPEQQGASIAAIVWVGTLGAALGPLLTPFEKAAAESLGLDEHVGPFSFAAAFFLVAATVVWARLRPDPLEVIGGIDPHAERVRLLRVVRSSSSVIWSSPGARLGIAALAASQAAMVGVMTMTPPHMKDHGHADLSALVIALHIVGMYGLSPWVGRFVDQRGAVRGIQVGAFILGAGTVATVMAGYLPVLMFVGLFFLGLGWSFGLIGGTTILTASVPEASRVEVQGTGDLTLSLCGAAAALSSGFVKASFGFHLLADGAAVLAAALLVLAWYTAATAPPAPRAT